MKKNDGGVGAGSAHTSDCNFIYCRCVTIFRTPESYIGNIYNILYLLTGKR